MKNGKRFPTSYWTVGRSEITVCSMVLGRIWKRILTLEVVWHEHEFWKVASIGQTTGYSASRIILNAIDTFEGIFPFHNGLLLLRIASLTPRD